MLLMNPDWQEYLILDPSKAELKFLTCFNVRATSKWKQAVVDYCPPSALPPHMEFAAVGFAWRVKELEKLGRTGNVGITVWSYFGPPHVNEWKLSKIILQLPHK